MTLVRRVSVSHPLIDLPQQEPKLSPFVAGHYDTQESHHSVSQKAMDFVTSYNDIVSASWLRCVGVSAHQCVGAAGQATLPSPWCFVRTSCGGRRGLSRMLTCTV